MKAEFIFSIWLLAVCNSFAIYGLWRAGDPNMILEKVKDWLEENLGDFASKPVLGCYKCMASLWAGVPMFFYMIAYHPTANVLEAAITAIFYTCLVSGMTIMIAALTDFMDYAD